MAARSLLNPPKRATHRPARDVHPRRFSFVIFAASDLGRISFRREAGVSGSQRTDGFLLSSQTGRNPTKPDLRGFSPRPNLTKRSCGPLPIGRAQAPPPCRKASFCVKRRLFCGIPSLKCVPFSLFNLFERFKNALARQLNPRVRHFTSLIHNRPLRHAIRNTVNLSKIGRSHFLGNFASAAALILPPRQSATLAYHSQKSSPPAGVSDR